VADFLLDLRQRTRACRRCILRGNTGNAPGHLCLAGILIVTVGDEQGLRRQQSDDDKYLPEPESVVVCLNHRMGH
jgi:hypothetical protein